MRKLIILFTICVATASFIFTWSYGAEKSKLVEDNVAKTIHDIQFSDQVKSDYMVYISHVYEDDFTVSQAKSLINESNVIIKGRYTGNRKINNDNSMFEVKVLKYIKGGKEFKNKTIWVVSKITADILSHEIYTTTVNFMKKDNDYLILGKSINNEKIILSYYNDYLNYKNQKDVPEICRKQGGN